jgi:hypothetical protein
MAAATTAASDPARSELAALSYRMRTGSPWLSPRTSHTPIVAAGISKPSTVTAAQKATAGQRRRPRGIGRG